MAAPDELETLVGGAAPPGPGRPRSARSAAFVACAVAAASGAAFLVRPGAPSTATLATTTLSFGVSNEYPTPKSLHRYPWSRLAEPYKTTTLTASSPCGAGCDYSWVVAHELRGARTVHFNGTGATADVVFTHAGSSYAVTLTATSASTGAVAATATLPVVCKYVRRSIAALTSADLERYLAAVEIIHREPSLAAGKRKYGPKFANSKWFTAMHLSRTTKDDCTPYHGSLSFLPSHEAFASRFDEALWSIDPSIAQPYWDTSATDEALGHGWASSLVFEKAVFGRSLADRTLGDAPPADARRLTAALDDGPAGHRFVDEGRFAYLPVATDGSLVERNAFGRQTMVWNEDDAPFVSRSFEVCGLRAKARLPGCAAVRGALNQSSLLDFQRKLETDVHGTLHPFAGGVWSCPVSFKDAVAARPDWAQLLTFAGTLLPTAYDVSFLMKQVPNGSPADDSRTRTNGYEGLQCPASCAANATFADCQCFDAYVDFHERNGSLTYDVAYGFLQDYLMMLERYYDSPRGSAYMERGDDGAYLWRTGRDADGGYLLETADQEAFTVLLARAVSHPGKVSPYGTPLASTNDPLFWPSHLGVMRVWHALRLRDQHKSPAYATWDWGPGATVFNRTSSCYGRNERDVLPFRHFMNEELREAAAAKGFVEDALGEAVIHPEEVDVFDYGAWAAQRRAMAALEADGWTMKADSRYYSSRELLDFYEPTNPRLQHIYDDTEFSACDKAR